MNVSIAPATKDPANLRIYDAQQVAAHYAALEYLTPCERLLFGSYIPLGSAVLDLGVGGGRTSGYLSQRASRYLGVDYAEAMVKACQKKFPELEFVVADAAHLSFLADQSFDAVVFSFNGIDCLLPDEARRSCLKHIHRVLKPGGVLIFSSHNPRAVVVRSGWNRYRLQQLARRLSGGSKLLQQSSTAVLTGLRLLLALGQSIWATLRRSIPRLGSPMFWKGEGTRLDPAHGGVLTHYWIPDRVIAEVCGMHFRVESVLGDDYPRQSFPYATDWYYYVFTKCERSEFSKN